MNRQATIYSLCDPTTGAIRYIGKAVDPKARLACHESCARKGHRTHVARWIASIAPLRPVLNTFLICDYEAAYQFEKSIIGLCRAAGLNLTNLTDGGEGGSGPRSAETRAKLAAAQRGRKHSEETRAKMRAARRGRPKSAEWVERIAQKHRGMKRTPEARAKMSVANKAWRAKKKRAAYTEIGAEQIAALNL